MAVASLVNLSSHSKNFIGLLDQSVLEALLMIATEEINEGPGFKYIFIATLYNLVPHGF